MALLELTPDKGLRFPKEPTEITTNVTVTLKLRNITNDWVAYKMKTTAPSFYLVRLSNGVIAPNASAEVQIIQKPMQKAAEYTQHRFLVQALKSPETGDKQDAKLVWERADKKNMQEQRLGVYFSSAAGGGGDKKDRPMDVQYRELVQYVEGLESKKKALIGGIGGGGGGAASSKSSSAQGGREFSFLQLIVAVVLALLAAKIQTMIM